MTDQDENRPLSRREIRLREMAAAGATSTGVEAGSSAQEAQTEPPAENAAPAEPAIEIEISLFDENGRQRSRRELRELREQALAEQAAAEEAEAPAATPTEVLDALGFEATPDDTEATAIEPDVSGDAAAVTPEPVVVDATEPDAAQAVASEPVLAETVAFDVIDDQQVIKEAEAFAATQAGIESEAIVATDFDALLQSAVVEATEAEEAADSEADLAHDLATQLDAETVEAVAPEVELEEQAEVAIEAESIADPLQRLEADAGEEDEPAEDIEPETQEVDASEGRSAFAAPVSAATGQSYSFPDITPLDEGHSIFDDPALRVMGSGAAGSNASNGDFDDLITRAVAQEGAASTTNTSALILPNLPEAEGLAGPLGETGELFITGSFDLPKSLSETGGHSALHDSVEAEQLDELGFSEPTPTGMMAPVSASRAVSARGTQGALVAEATKDKSKMPVVLIATGGVLVLGAAGLIVWAAASGLFG